MKITFLGTGTSQGVPIIGCKCRVCDSLNPKDKRLRSSVMIEVNGEEVAPSLKKEETKNPASPLLPLSDSETEKRRNEDKGGGRWVKRFIIDTGPDFRQQMIRERVDRIDAVIYTHEHRDHVAGLDDVRAFNFSMKKKVDLYASARVQH